MSLPYERGPLLPDTAADVAKLRAAWRIVARRHRERTLYDFTGLERSLELGDVEPGMLDDDLAPALVGDRLAELALEHLGGVDSRDDVFVANRLTAAIVAAMQVLVRPGETVLGISPAYSHPVVHRAVRLAGGELVDVVGAGDVAADLERLEPALVVLTRLAVSYEALAADDLERVALAAEGRGIPVFVDDAGGARVGPAVFGQPKTLELGAVAGATGLDKYGTTGPRLGLLAGRAELVGRIRARAVELGLEARPMLYPAVVRSLEQYDPARVRALVAATTTLGDELEARLPWVDRTPVAVKLQGEDIIRAIGSGLVPYEATAALAMLLLRDHGILTVHFAALPPGTSALLLKFVPPETLERFGGPVRFVDAVESSLAVLAETAADEQGLRELLGVGGAVAV